MILLSDAIIQPDESIAVAAINLATFLAVLCFIFIAGFVATRFSKKSRQRFSDFFEGQIDLLLWLVPTTAMAFSLFFSEYLGWSPCRLCWFQRGFIYPLAVLMLFNYFKPNINLRRIGFVLAMISPFISAYHVWVEIKGEESSFCSVDVSCATIWFKTLGFLTIPGMALTACVTMLVLFYMSGIFSKVPSKAQISEKVEG